MIKMNTLYGKKISFTGDSICEGVGYPGGYGKIIAERNSMEYQNLGIGGGTVAPDIYVNGKVRFCISASIKNMDIDSDYAIIEGGVNDATYYLSDGAPRLGELTSGYSGPFDTTTFIGAFETMLRDLTVRFAGKKIGYIAVHQCAHAFRPEVVWGKADNFFLAALKCCRKWGVPYLDLTSTVPAMSFFRVKYEGTPELELISAENTKNNDGSHPNLAGYTNYYCDKIERWLKSL